MFNFNNFNRYGINFKEDTQKTRILKILQYYENKPVNVWKLMLDSRVCHCCEIIRLLRKSGYNIINKTFTKDNILHSSYTLIK